MSRGVPSAATLYNIVNSLFQNELISDKDLRIVVTFSQATLTEAQKAQLTYSKELSPINFYIVYQEDKFSCDDLVSSALQLVSFSKGRGNFIYGSYFVVSGQKRFDICELSESECNVKLMDSAVFTSSKYLEVYNDVNGTTVILAQSTLNKPYASLQYSHQCRYYFEQLNDDGIINTNIPKTELTSLSQNLRNI